MGGVDPPDRMGDVVRPETGGGDLVEQGPESVVVVPVDDGDVDGCRRQPQGGVEAPESGTDDDHLRPATLARCCWLTRG